jgi:hypothetical protein
MNNYKKEREFNHKGAEGARRRKKKTTKNDLSFPFLCAFVRLCGSYSSSCFLLYQVI